VEFEPEDLERTRPEMIWAMVNASAATIALTGHRHAEFADASQALQHGDAEPARRLMSDEVLRHVLLWGPPEVIGLRLAELARELRPDSIGLSLLQRDVPKALQACAAAFASMHTALGDG
jgi:hypothetical protein